MVMYLQLCLLTLQANENKQNHLTCPKECISAPSPPFLAFTVNPAQVPVIQAASEYMIPRNCKNF